MTFAVKASDTEIFEFLAAERQRAEHQVAEHGDTDRTSNWNLIQNAAATKLMDQGSESLSLQERSEVICYGARLLSSWETTTFSYLLASTPVRELLNSRFLTNLEEHMWKTKQRNLHCSAAAEKVPVGWRLLQKVGLIDGQATQPDVAELRSNEFLMKQIEWSENNWTAVSYDSDALAEQLESYEEAKEAANQNERSEINGMEYRCTMGYLRETVAVETVVCPQALSRFRHDVSVMNALVDVTVTAELIGMRYLNDPEPIRDTWRKEVIQGFGTLSALGVLDSTADIDSLIDFDTTYAAVNTL